MSKYYYCVNTFNNDMEPIQLNGYVEAESNEEAIQQLVDNGVVYSRGYEFLDLYVV